MRWSEALIPTLREVPKEAEAKSHQLMLKAGYIRKLSAGVYSYLPLGFCVLQNVISVIRQEMNRAGAIEVLMPALHPAELWKKTGRYEALGADKFAFKNRSDQEFVLGPTHEEIITELAGAYLKSYQQLPKTLYQIQTKFRDEVRPRFGIIRTKEFIMKDAYSFDADETGLDRSYQIMYQAYEKIFARLGLKIDIVHADPGIMGGNMSHEFMVRSPYGEDRIVVCSGCDYLASFDIASRALEKKKNVVQAALPIEIFDTPNLKTIVDLTEHFKIRPEMLVKTILYMTGEGKAVAACVRGDHEVHEGKLRKLTGSSELRLAHPDEIERLSGAPVGFAGPVGLEGVLIAADSDVRSISNFVTGANQKDKHYRNVNLDRDFKPDYEGDIRYVHEGDDCAKCGGKLSFVTTMEVGHVFKLGTRYTKALEASYRAEDGAEHLLIMGCYGLGVNRIVAAIVEQYSDEKGMCWPLSVAPFAVELITINQADEMTKSRAETIYQDFQQAGISCLFDDRNERAGVKFNDADLIGVPIQVIVGERNLTKGQIEIKVRKTRESQLVAVAELLPHLKTLLV